MKKKSFIKWVRGKNQLIVSNEKALLGDFKNIKSGHATVKTFSYFDLSYV
jgi:phage antirepressor YoqD-like protein